MVARRLIGTSDSNPEQPDTRGYAGWRTTQIDGLTWAQVRVSTQADRAIVTMSGEVDLASTGIVGPRLFALVDQGFVKIVIDLSGVEFCDVHALGVLARVSRRAARGGGWLRMASARPRVVWVIDVVRLSRTLPVYGTVQDALEGRTDAEQGTAAG